MPGIQCRIPGRINAEKRLVRWDSMQTNSLAGTSLGFADPDGASYPQRYYRVLLVQ
jgi:hypothetical protein